MKPRFKRERRHIHDLPDEILTETFDCLPSFGDLVRVAHVCQLWRDLGIDHPRFWKRISIKSVTPSSLGLLRGRLGQSNGRPFALDVNIEGLDPLIRTELLPLICSTIDNVEFLSIHLDAMYLKDLWGVLNNSAPRLRQFQLEFYSPDRLLPHIAITPWIFGRSSGVLEGIWVTDAIIPYESPIGFPAFTNLSYVIYHHPHSSTRRFPNYLFEYCPNLTYLDFQGGTLTFDEGITPEARRGLARLSSLTVNLVPESMAEFIRRVPTTEIPRVILAHKVDFDTVYDAFGPLRSPFNFAAHAISPDLFWIALQDKTSSFQRIFVDEQRGYARLPDDNDDANVLFENEELAAQLSSLSVSVSLWSKIIPYLRLFASVPHLKVEFDAPCSAAPRALPKEPFRCTNLITLTLMARHGFVYVTAGDLIAFVERTAPACDELELRNVLVEGGVEQLKSRFSTIKQSTELLWPSSVLIPRVTYCT